MKHVVSDVKSSPTRASKPANKRGFLLLVVVGLLAVLMIVSIGFLSFTRGEVMAVNTQRNKGDTQDIMRSALDYTIANICHDLMDGSGNMDQNKSCAYTIVPGTASGAPWWFRTMQLGTCKFLPQNTASPTSGGWNFPLKPATQPGAEAQWIYFPVDFFPGGAIRARAQVLVFDTNACININDWNEDCNPSQAQMAHMFVDAYGFQNLENMRWFRDAGNPGHNGPLPSAPLRYQEGWREGSHSARYVFWPDWDWINGGAQINNTASYSWVTGNTSWLSMYGPQYSCISGIIPSDGLWFDQATPAISYQGSKFFATINPSPPVQFSDRSSPNVDPEAPGGAHHFCYRNPQSAGILPWCLPGFYTTAYSDPDTGRSPININTCYNSGEVLPFDYWNNPPSYTMEGVWNVESLRRIIKVGYFYDPWPSKNRFNPATGNYEARPAGNSWSHAQYDWIFLDPRSKMLVETLKLQLAYQYQETLCRYFTGSYSHANQNQKFPPYSNTAIATYAATYKAKTPPPYPAHACAVTDYTSPRFPVSLTQFRKNVHDDFSTCLASINAAQYLNPDYAASGNTPLIPARLANDDPAHTDGSVNFTYVVSPPGHNNQIVYYPEVAQGKLDMRTACACYDNMIPGKPADITDFQGCNPYDAGDPIYEMYVLQQGRQEDYDDPYQIDPGVIHGGYHGSYNAADNRVMRTYLGANSGAGGGPPFPLAAIPDPKAWPNVPPSWPLPWPLPAAKSAPYADSGQIGNIYSRWVDNPQLNATSRYSSNTYPNTGNEMELYDHNVSGTPQPQTILPKGNDICSYNSLVGGKATAGYLPFNVSCGFKKGPLVGSSPPVPTGPWLDDLRLNPAVTTVSAGGYTITGRGFNQMDRQANPPGGQQPNHDVPWRQMCFTPDSFSTELTTTSTTFIVIVNAQLVDQASVAANPGNSALHVDQSWNQWGMVVELAPDVYAEKQSVPEPPSDFVFPMGGYVTPDPNMVTTNGPAAPKGVFFNWYLNEMPRRTKTYQGTVPMFSADWATDSWLDDLCISLAPRNIGNTGAYNTPYGRTSGQPRMYGGQKLPWHTGGNVFTPPLVGNMADPENSTSTHIRDWKKSQNPLNEATTGCDIKQVPPAGVPSGRGADVIYTPGNQIKKRVIIRSVWCLNEGIEQ
jgi:hypothetical protein